MDRRAFLDRVGRGGLTAGALGVAGIGGAGFTAGRNEASHRLADAIESRCAASGGSGSTRVWWSVETSEKIVALTFDDGPTEEFTGPVLDLLASYDIPATFFVIGALVERRPDDVRRMREAGHEIGNHTYDHVTAEHLDPRDVLATVERGADAIAGVLGDRPRWFRPVKGHVTGAVLRAASKVGHDVAIWSLQRGQAADDDTAGVARHLTSGLHEGAIVLLHDGIGDSALDPDGGSQRLIRRRRTEFAVLPDVLERWLAEGYRFVTLSTLVEGD